MACKGESVACKAVGASAAGLEASAQQGAAATLRQDATAAHNSMACMHRRIIYTQQAAQQGTALIAPTVHQGLVRFIQRLEGLVVGRFDMLRGSGVPAGRVAARQGLPGSVLAGKTRLCSDVDRCRAADGGVCIRMAQPARTRCCSREGGRQQLRRTAGNQTGDPPRAHVGVVGHRLLAEGLLDLGLGRAWLQAQHRERVHGCLRRSGWQLVPWRCRSCGSSGGGGGGHCRGHSGLWASVGATGTLSNVYDRLGRRWELGTVQRLRQLGAWASSAGGALSSNSTRDALALSSIAALFGAHAKAASQARCAWGGPLINRPAGTDRRHPDCLINL